MKWTKIFENGSFVVDYSIGTGEMRISYFDNNHFQNEVILPAEVQCWGRKYYHINNGCNHPHGDICISSELWQPKEEEQY